MDSKLLGRIKSEFISGEKTLQEAADEYNVPYSTLTKKSHEGKWKNLRKECGKKTERKIVESVSAKKAKKAVDLFDIADLLADKVREIAETVSDPDTIKKLTSAIKDIRDIKGIKSEADMREQEARINKLRREAEREDDTTSEIEIVFKAGEEAWNE